MVQRWALESLAVFRVIADYAKLAKLCGVQMRMFTTFHLNNIDGDGIKREKIEFIKSSNLDGYSRGPHLFEKYSVNVDSHVGLQDAYEHLAPIINTDVAMAFITRLVEAKGALMETDTIHGDLLHQEANLLALYGADAIVNATGVWAKETAADDDVYALRGGLLRIINDSTDFLKIKNAMVVSSESKFNGDFRDMAFLVPRNDNILLLGYILHQEAWDLDLTPDCDAIREMRARYEDLLPVLKAGHLPSTAATDPRCRSSSSFSVYKQVHHNHILLKGAIFPAFSFSSIARPSLIWRTTSLAEPNENDQPPPPWPYE